MDAREQKIYSDRIKTGKQTYFPDVKATCANDYFLTITESQRHPQGNGFTYAKHKFFSTTKTSTRSRELCDMPLIP